MRVVLSNAAQDDLEAIADYIAKDNPRRALSFVQELRLAAMALGDMPRAFPLVPRYAHHRLHCRPVGNYLIFYRAEQDQVVIVHILHGARDHTALLFPEDPE